MAVETENTITPIEYVMNNEINGECVRIIGNGFHDSSGLISVNSTVSSIPPGWNSLVSIFICSGPSPGTGSSQTTSSLPDSSPGLIGFFPNGYKTADNTLRQAAIWNSDGKRIVSIDATGIYEKTDKKFKFNINVKTRIDDLNALTKMSGTNSYHFLVQQKKHGFADVITQYNIDCIDGSQLFGATNIHYEGLGNLKDMKKIKNPLVGFNEITMNSNKNLLQYTIRQHIKDASKLGLK